MGFFDDLLGSFNPSSWFGESGNSMLDLLDPGNTFHDSASKRLSNQQFQMEYDIANRNYEEQIRQYDLNYAQQVEAYNYQKDLNALQMEREDTAVQRRVADLKASGLSPTLAAGSAAGATPVHAGTVPQRDVPQMATPSDVKVRAAMFREGLIKDRMELASSLLGNIANVSRSAAETQLLKAQAKSQSIHNEFLFDELSGALKSVRLDNERKTIENNVQESIAPMRIQSMSKELRQQDIDYANSVLESKSKEAQILIQNAELVEQELKNKLAESTLDYNIDEARLKTISLGITIEQMSVDLEATKRDNKLYEEMFPDEPRPVADKLAGTHSFSLPYILGGGAISWASWISKGVGYIAKPFKAVGSGLKSLMSIPLPKSNSNFKGVTRFN